MRRPNVRIRRSSKTGFVLVSVCPYQYTRGTRALDETDVGADVAAVPRGLAGENVGIGESTGQAEMEPGDAHPPYE